MSQQDAVLVTGGAGFIGSHIVDKLIDRGNKVVVIDDFSTGRKENLNPEARLYEMDIRDDLTEVFAENNINYVIHQAAQVDVQKSLQKPAFDSDVNINGTINLLKYCVKERVKKIIYASSAAVYGHSRYLGIDEQHPVNPISYYGISKHTPEHYLKVFNNLHGFTYTILRYSNAYGVRQDPKGEGGVISIFVDQLLKGERPVIFGDGRQTRDFIYVDDIAAANLAAVDKGDNEIINISCNQQISINQLVEKMNDILGTSLKPRYKEERAGDIRHSYLVNDKAKKILNWKPNYNLERGLEETFKYYQKFYKFRGKIAAAKK